VALTRDFLPHLHEPAAGLLVDIGCMGRGVGLQNALGAAMAEYVATGRREALPLPPVPMTPLPFHALHRAYLAAIIAWYRMRGAGVGEWIGWTADEPRLQPCLLGGSPSRVGWAQAAFRGRSPTSTAPAQHYGSN
jgi:hypothetical protein